MTAHTQLATIVTEHELGELAALIEQRTGILFDETRAALLLDPHPGTHGA